MSQYYLLNSRLQFVYLAETVPGVDGLPSPAPNNVLCDLIINLQVCHHLFSLCS